ncbi:MAG: MOSC domain-containing protein [Rhizobiales bacterium]|nr:MOSC domain-containing protein [Hyphomicrobiales bacterium]
MSESSRAQIASLYRYPVKGLSPQEIGEAQLTEAAHFPGDRMFAIENGPSGFDAKAAEHLPKQKFLMLMRNERLARLRTHFDDETRVLSIRQGGGVVAASDVDSDEGRAAIARFFETFMGEEMRGAARLLVAPPGFRFMDSRSGFLSLINLASVAAIAKLVGRDGLDPLRFRGNIHLSGMEPWAEFDLVGRTIALGSAELEVLKRIDRCAATDVDPKAGLRDLRLVATLEQNLQHHDCGIYARVTRSGLIRPGDAMRVVG